MLIFDYVDPAVLTADVREEPEPANYALNTILPDRERVDVKTAWLEATQTNRTVKFRSWDAETPIGRRDVVERKSMALPPLGEKYVLDEFEQLELNRLRGQNADQVVEAVYDDARRGARGIRARMELARGDVLTDGKFTLAGENGLTIEVDYGVPAGNLVAPATVWSNPASTPLTDLLTWLDTYVDLNGGLPGAIVTSRSVVGDLLRNEEIRTMSRGGVGTVAPSSVSRADLDALFDSRDIPRIVTYDARVDVDGTTTRPIPADRVIFVPDDPGNNLGTTDWGITVEGLGLVKAGRIALQEAPGIIAVNLEQGDPARLWTKVSAVGVPVLKSPKHLMVADVK